MSVDLTWDGRGVVFIGGVELPAAPDALTVTNPVSLELTNVWSL
ncbi:hypothetical protein GCM10010124_36660 [Pilimelia terevasa]|uniref:Uncharacterized protein n=1 Tax=Pilimelia terevasa TaxID=53372 RepID=A0A8J3BQA8_9ACTN|nr:hypothetical protein GCM10010124_36660 [Pilimelia terevasa]